MIHTDIKLSNILMDPNYSMTVNSVLKEGGYLNLLDIPIVKLSDLGNAHTTNPRYNIGKVSAFSYRAPEVWFGTN